MKTVLPFVSLLLVAGGAEAASVAPHRAIYDLTLLRATEGAQMRSAAGKLAFEIDGSRCEGYTVNFRMATKYRQESGESTLIDTLSTTYESGAATELRHQSKESVNGTVRGSERTTLNRKTAESEATVELKSKPGEPFTVPAGTALQGRFVPSPSWASRSRPAAMRATAPTVPRRPSRALARGP